MGLEIALGLMEKGVDCGEGGAGGGFVRCYTWSSAALWMPLVP